MASIYGSAWPSTTRSEISSTTAGHEREPRHVPYQELPIECTYDWCQHRFASVKEMKRHKRYDPEHFYCRRCDVDCEDWDDLTRHKVDNMAPYVEHKKKATEDDMPAHIVCEFCGEDFRSFGGRKIHREQMHQADQDVVCVGCSIHFIRASSMIEHLEQGHCISIPRSEFHARIQHKYWIQQYLESTRDPRPPLVPSTAGSMADEPADQEEGGVQLLDEDDEAQVTGASPLQPEISTMSSVARGLESYPPLSDAEHSSFNNAMSKRSLSSSTSDAGTRASKNVTDTSSQMSASTRGTLGSPPAWSTGRTANTLFPEAPPAQPGDWNAIQAERELQAQRNEETNLFRARVLRPQDPAFDVDTFYNPLIRQYCCPVPGCDGGFTEFLAASDLREHLNIQHTRQVFNCPTCGKRFPTVAALVRHVESTRKCTVKERQKFAQFLSDTTGGFLNAKDVHQPSVYRPETAVVKHGQVINGVMSKKFIGTKANDW